MKDILNNEMDRLLTGLTGLSILRRFAVETRRAASLQCRGGELKPGLLTGFKNWNAVKNHENHGSDRLDGAINPVRIKIKKWKMEKNMKNVIVLTGTLAVLLCCNSCETIKLAPSSPYLDYGIQHRSTGQQAHINSAAKIESEIPTSRQYVEQDRYDILYSIQTASEIKDKGETGIRTDFVKRALGSTYISGSLTEYGFVITGYNEAVSFTARGDYIGKQNGEYVYNYKNWRIYTSVEPAKIMAGNVDDATVRVMVKVGDITEGAEFHLVLPKPLLVWHNNAPTTLKELTDERSLFIGTGSEEEETTRTAETLNLSGRSVAGGFPMPVYNSPSQGTVVVEIAVNRDGQVTEAQAIGRGTTTSDRKLLKAAEEAALKTRFNVKKDAPISQVGTITYVFSLK
jgi:TonB family protein